MTFLSFETKTRFQGQSKKTETKREKNNFLEFIYKLHCKSSEQLTCPLPSRVDICSLRNLVRELGQWSAESTTGSTVDKAIDIPVNNQVDNKKYLSTHLLASRLPFFSKSSKLYQCLTLLETWSLYVNCFFFKFTPISVIKFKKSIYHIKRPTNNTFM